MSDFIKRTWAEISLENIKHNYRSIKARLPEGCRFLGVVKADAYGHGSIAVSRALQDAGADYLAVSCLNEAIEIRDAGVRLPLLILGHTPAEYTELLIKYDITQTVTCLAKAKEYSEVCSKLNRELRVHIKVDTGMGRLGFLCKDDFAEDGVENMAAACGLPGLRAEGIFTHFSVSDEPGTDNEAYTKSQFDLFLHVIDELKDRFGISFGIRHCANSGAVLHYPETALDMVRPGLLLYGYGDTENRFGLRPCMRLVTTVSTIKTYPEDTFISYGRRFKTERKTRMGVLSIGYADGLLRSLSNRAAFWSEGSLIPQRGTICMDMCMAELTDAENVHVGSEVEIFGEHSSLEALSQAAGTIPYELMCSVSKRVPRIYV